MLVIVIVCLTAVPLREVKNLGNLRVLGGARAPGEPPGSPTPSASIFQ